MLKSTDFDDLKALISDQIREVGIRYGVVIEYPTFMPSYLIYTPPGHYPLTFGNVQSHYSPVKFATKDDKVRTSQSIISFTVSDNKLSIRLQTLVTVFKNESSRKSKNLSKLYFIDLCKDDIKDCLDDLYLNFINVLAEIINDCSRSLSIL